MKIISLFNNKGGVGKTTLAFHLACVLSEMQYRVLMVDLDPQCNLTICSLDENILYEIWKQEDDFVDDFDSKSTAISRNSFLELLKSTRTIHFLLKPTEDGVSDFSDLPPPFRLRPNLDIIPGRLTMHMFENKIAERWSASYQGDPLSLRTITQIRNICENYVAKYNYDYVVIDTSPSLGSLNKVIISTVDGFIVPCMPDMFSLYGIRNIGDSLSKWKKEFDTIFSLISGAKRSRFPKNFVQFMGYTIYNAKKYSGKTPWDLALAHYNFARMIPETIFSHIKENVRPHIPHDIISDPIGMTAIMHSHNTLPNMSQKYKRPIWEIPGLGTGLDSSDKSTVIANKIHYEGTKQSYISFADDLIKRMRMCQ